MLQQSRKLKLKVLKIVVLSANQEILEGIGRHRLYCQVRASPR